MSAKIKATRLFIALFVLFSVIYYEIVTASKSEKKGALLELRDIKRKLVKSSDEDEIAELLKESDRLYATCKDDAVNMYNAFFVIEILSMLNLTYMT